MKNLIGSILLLFASCYGNPAFSDSHGHFPGRGSWDAFNKAAFIVNEGVALANKKNYDAAISCYRKALAIYPYDSAIYQNLAFALKSQKKFNEAITFYRKALELEPNYLSALLGCAESNWDLNKTAEAEKYYRKAVAVKPDSYEAVANLGDLLREKGEYKEARVFLVRAKSCPKCKDFPGEIEASLKQCDEEEKRAMKEASH